jgi:hypothetical protein
MALVGASATAKDNPATAAAARRDPVSVRDFGAVGDGVTDDHAAFQSAHDALSAAGNSVGGEITVPATANGYFLGRTWQIRKRVTIRGAARGDQPNTSAARLIFPPDTTGIRCYSTLDSGTGEGADFTRIVGLNLSAKAKGSRGHGIESTTEVFLEDCVVHSFAGHGVYIHGQTGPGATGISDLSRLMGVRCVTNGGDGIHIQGNDSNVITVIDCSCSNNGGYGYYDNAAYCNTYIGCHEAGGGAGSYYNRNATGLGGVYLGCYTESGNPTNFDGSVVVIGGVMPRTGNFGAQVYATGGLMFNVMTPHRHVFLRNNVEIGRIETDNTLRNFAGAKFGTASNYIALNASAASRIDLSQPGNGGSTRIAFGNGNGTVGTIQTNGSATTYNTSSDYRLKERVRLMAGPDAVARIMRLRPVTYRWKADGAPGQGFIAHELQAVFPEAVTGEKDACEVVEVQDEEGKVVGTQAVPKYQGIDTSFLVAPLVALTQEHQGRLEALSRRIAALEEALGAREAT